MIIKDLVAVCHSFCLFFIFSNIHTIIQSHSHNTFAEASLHLLIACKLSGTDLPVVPSRESNSGLPSSKPTRYQLSHAAPCEPRRTIILWLLPLLNQTWILFDWSFEKSGIFNLKAMGYLQKQCKEKKSCWDPGGSGSLVDLTEVFTFWRNPFLICQLFYKKDPRNSKSSLAEWTFFWEPSFYVQDHLTFYFFEPFFVWAATHAQLWVYYS